MLAHVHRPACMIALINCRQYHKAPTRFLGRLGRFRVGFQARWGFVGEVDRSLQGVLKVADFENSN